MFHPVAPSQSMGLVILVSLANQVPPGLPSHTWKPFRYTQYSLYSQPSMPNLPKRNGKTGGRAKSGENFETLRRKSIRTVNGEPTCAINL